MQIQESIELAEKQIEAVISRLQSSRHVTMTSSKQSEVDGFDAKVTLDHSYSVHIAPYKYLVIKWENPASEVGCRTEEVGEYEILERAIVALIKEWAADIALYAILENMAKA